MSIRTDVKPETRRPPTVSATAPAPRRRRTWTPYLFLLPALALELVVHFGPMLAGLVMSLLKLTQYQLARWWEAPWTGFGNFEVVLDVDQPVGASLLSSFLITLAFTVIVIAASWVMGTAAAVSLQNARVGRGVLRTLFLVPYALPAFAAVITWRFLFQRDNGMVNHVLVDQLGVLDENAFFLLGSNAFWAQCVVAVWRLWPFAFLMLMAGLQSIPGELYEAGTLDGAGPWRQFREITLPLLAPVNQVLVLVMFLWTFKEFETPFVLFGGSAPEQARLINVEIYQNSFVTWNFGLGAAMSAVLLLFLLLVTGVYLLATRRKVHEA
ncbi:carbohydrate ABC transporter permease [Lentzea aerocolonigenes]|uniref:carbohydrate ABC transporter permease n=1 Tax=Lentzea aerocolonigenes TaxID=68170 RepID=UPI0004C43CE6|nr:sugar ABC transporter permease [Lentzea aerocolonigenes]MCP2244479.1 carbohydrate ABC transporter membrane protein 1, CUT1 family (TC 3.A.1.1.-) [Lentzea aerocolonigenes]